MRFPLLVLPLLLILNCSSPGGTGDQIDLSGEWLLTQAGKLSMDSATGHEERIRLPGSWTPLLKHNADLTSLISLRKDVFIDHRFRGKLLYLSLGTIAIADETYFNGVLIGRTGSIPDEGNGLKYGFNWLKKRKYTIPENLVKPGEQNEIHIRVYSHIINGINGDLYIADREDTAGYSRLLQGIPDLDAKTIIINIILGAFVIIILEAYKKRRAIFFTVIIITILTVIHLTLLGIGYESGLTRFRVILALYSAGYLFFTLAVEEFFNKSFRYSLPILVSLSAGANLAVFLAPDSRSLMYFAGSATIISNILMILYYTGIFLLALRENFRRYWIFLLVAIPLVVTTAQTYTGFISMEFQRMSSVFLLHLPMVFIAILLILLIDFINVHTEINLIRGVLAFKTRAFNRIQKKLKIIPAEEPGEKLRELLLHLDRNYIEKYNRAELAGKFGMNEDYMCQVFRKKTGTTISNYINRKRVDASKDLLLNTDSKIIDIAFHVGFESLVHFHREFKKSVGMTPQGYRKNRNQGT